MSSSTQPLGTNVAEHYISDDEMDLTETGIQMSMEPAEWGDKVTIVHCRLCTTIIHKSEAVSIYESEKNIADKISQCVPVLIVPQDDFSKYICETCSDQLELCTDLILKSIEAEKFFRRKQFEEKLQKQELAKKNKKTMQVNKTIRKNLSPDGPVICDLCGHKRFTNMETFDSHMISIHDAPQLGHPELVFLLDGRAQYECRACRVHCDTEPELREHEKSHTDLTCKSCGQFHSTAQALHHHSCPSAAIVPYSLLSTVCNICDATFEKYAQLRIHMREEHVCGPFDEQPSQPEEEEDDEAAVDDVEAMEDDVTGDVSLGLEEKPTKFQCLKCDRRFVNLGNLARHAVTHFEQSCDVCQKKFTSPTALAKHRRQHGDCAARESGGGGSIVVPDTCHKCGRVFTKHTELVKHLESEHNIPRSESSPWCCRFCNKRMMTKLSLSIHERIHTGQRPFTCDWCGQGFRSKANLLQHHPVHTGVRKYSCNVCGKAFSRKSFVTTHMRVHTGDRPYGCDVCQAKFTQVGDMRRHRKKHEEKSRGGIYVKPPSREKQSNLLLSEMEEQLYEPDGELIVEQNPVSIIEIHIPGENTAAAEPNQFRMLTYEDETIET
uniref:Zinc finger protein 2 homolog n=1 Tax=Cacopsylla melanoneura TaxID=428564 RepID=A0A8D8M7S2_9HEMI